jgi:hypothetical protein
MIALTLPFALDMVLVCSLQNAIEASMNYDKCLAHKGDARLTCQLDKALTNVGSLLASQVEGRVCTEIDPRLADDTGGDALGMRLLQLPLLKCQDYSWQLLWYSSLC